VKYDQPVSDVERLMAGLSQLPEPVVRPALVVISGLPGTGKSYFGQRLARRWPFVILESDALRRTLFPSPDYSSQESWRLFKAVHLLIERLLEKGVSVILDATNLAERHREYLYSIAERRDVRLVLVRVEAPPEVVRQRLKARVETAQANSEADWGVYRKMRPSLERISRKHYAVDTSRDITPVLDKIIREVRK